MRRLDQQTRRADGFYQCIDARRAVQGQVVILAQVDQYLVGFGLEFGFGFLVIGYRLTGHGAGVAARIQGHVQLDADAVGLRFLVVGVDGVGAGFADAGDRIETRRMAGAVFLDFLGGGFDGMVLRENLRVALQRDGFPFVEAGRLHRLHAKVVTQPVQHGDFLPHYRGQRVARVGHLVLRFEHLRFGQVELCLGFQHVGSGALAFFEHAVVHAPLFGVGIALHERQGQMVFGVFGLGICADQAHDLLLVAHGKLRVAVIGLRDALIIAGDAFEVDQRLAQLDRARHAGVIALLCSLAEGGVGGDVRLILAVRVARRQAGQQAGAPQHLVLLPRLVFVNRRTIGRIILQRGLVGLDQAERGRRACLQQAKG